MTLDGKKAGLQRASDLKDEMETLRKKEKEKFKRLDASVSGRGAETMVRGRLKEKQREEEEKARRAKEDLNSLSDLDELLFCRSVNQVKV